MTLLCTSLYLSAVLQYRGISTSQPFNTKLGIATAHYVNSSTYITVTNAKNHKFTYTLTCTVKPGKIYISDKKWLKVTNVEEY